MAFFNGGIPMIRVDAYFFYQIGAFLTPLTRIKHEDTRYDVVVKLYDARNWLSALLGQDLIRIRTALAKGHQLLASIQRLQEIIEKQSAERPESLQEAIGWSEGHLLSSQSTEFQTVLAAELSLGDIYVVSPKGGFDTTILAEAGVRIFPSDLLSKVPEAANDAREAARCIAFELPTAAAFHLHRVHELVLRRYYDAVTKNAPRPINRNIGAYMDALKNNEVKDPIVLGALASLKNFHRNPVLHPDDRLHTVEQAIALHGQIVSVITYMLQKLPEPLILESPLVPIPQLEEMKDEITVEEAEQTEQQPGNGTNAV